ncbi:cadherin-related family member 5-like isoform X1 [Girardinichthys multiradiatus]|uniref:cadherin-related family member 5-like isoform X1 n=1 Tax=Girardinichthys multiradiatus TaxID=208333 RepID=UPI001FABCBB7|nr:cadherin-related family member 5-like isoform X1 [Girardinichthys multiradiatus]
MDRDSDREMDRTDRHLSVSRSFIWLLLVLLQTSNTTAQSCSVASPVNFPENNEIGQVVTTISVLSGEEIIITSEGLPFGIEGNNLIATAVLDHEETQNYAVNIRCNGESGSISKTIVVILLNENDNIPFFDQNLYQASVNEMSPIDTSVGHFAATDLDGPLIYYRLIPESDAFKLRSQRTPDILINTRLDYDKVKEVRLILEAQDTPLDIPEEPSFTSTTTIMISILDIDNRPPWFQPCTSHETGGAVICENSGYTGNINLNEQETGVLSLKPGPLHAIDGDLGIKEEITYSFLSGNNDGLFEINPNTGNITMLKPADVLGPIALTVLAAQRINSHQFSTTTVTITVQVKSFHVPKFQKPQYEGLITSVGSMAMDPTNKDQPLQILATDEDYSGTGGLNPHIAYSVEGRSDFAIVGGYLFLTKELSEGSLSLQVVAKDTSNDEMAKAALRVELKLGLTTTTLPQSTTDFMTTTSIEGSTTDSKTTNEVMSTSDPSMSTDISAPILTTNPTEGVSPANTARPVVPSGGFGVTDMAALGATLGVLLFVCLLVIGVLVYRMQKGNAAWKKIKEVSVFRSSLGQGSGDQKEGIQYTNEAFQKDNDDRSSTGSGGPEGGSITGNTTRNIYPKEEIPNSSAQQRTPSYDNTSDTSSDRVDDEKEVKPILTKERRVEEGYKSVWFKEDIDPNAKEEVVIIPQNQSEESEEEDEEPSSSHRKNENDNFQQKSPKVNFADTDLDSGLGVKFDDPADDSESDKELNIDL